MTVDPQHRVGRVLSFSPVVGVGTPPPPHPQASVSPPPLVPGGGAHSLAIERLESPNSDEGTYTVILFIHMYFVTPEAHLQQLELFLPATVALTVK